MTVSAMLTLLVQGFGKSLEIFTLTLLGSLPLGLLVMFGRRSRVAPLRWLVKLFISVMRGTPLMLQLMVVYYGPFLLFDFTPPGNWRFGAVIVGFVINYAAYFAEIYRAGYESIPVGQFEAAQVLGYTGGQTFGRILLPQMIRRVLPPVTNEVITLVKDTSLASVIGTVEMFTRAKQIVASPNTPGMLALAAAGHSEVTVLPEKVFNEYASYYTTAGVNLRSGPSTSYGKVQLVDRGTKVKAAAKEGNWTFVSVGSKFGWISSDYLSTKPPVEVTSGSLSRT